MKKSLFFISFLFFCLPFSLSAMDTKLPVTIDADQISFLQQKNQIIAEGNVVLKHEKVILYCDKVIYDAQSNKAQVVGEAKIVRGDSTAYGHDIVYDFTTLDVKVDELRISQPPIYGKAARIKEEDDKYVLEEGHITTCELDEPHYRIVAKSVTVYPGRRVVARNVLLKVGNFPLFYLPYFSQSLQDESFPIEISPGRSSQWGYYLLSRLRYNFDDQNKGRIIFDWHQKRGQGFGLSHKFDTKNYGKSLLRYYRIQDELYRAEKRQEFMDQYPSRDSQNLNSSRYKAQFFYNWQPTSRFSLVSEFNKLSDKYFMKDFFEQEYDSDPEPRSYLLASYSFDNSGLSLFAQKRVNRFFGQNEYLPQLEYNLYRQQLGKSRFHFGSVNKAGNLRETQIGSGETNDAFRTYSDNVLSYGNSVGWLSLNPYVGAYSAYYSRNIFGQKHLFRAAPKAGLILNTSLYNTFDYSRNFLGERIDQFRHIFIPEVSYEYVGKPTISNDELFQFDRYDDLERKQNIIFRLDNKLQARNEERVWDFLYFSPAVEYRIDQEGPKGGHFNKITADLEVYPARNLSFNSEATYKIPPRHFSEVNADLTFSSRQKVDIDYQKETIQRPRYSVSLGHRYSRADSSLGTMGITYNLTPKIKFKNYLRYEYASGDLEKQQYAFRFDLHCWWMDLGLDLDRHERGGRDTTVWMAFTLKAFPELNVDFSQTFDGAKTSY